jgi:branched-subunit amino acid transport protein
VTTSSFALLIATSAVATYLTRWPSILIGRLMRVSPRIRNGLDYIPIGVFAAMIAPAVALHKSGTHTVDFPFLGGFCIALCTAVLTKNPLWTMIAGVVSVALLRCFG